MEIPKILGCYTFWGIDFEEQSGDEFIGTCICKNLTSERANVPRLYVNGNTGVFSCKVCGREGSWRDFLAYVHEVYLKNTTEEDLMYMVKIEGIPLPSLLEGKVARDEIKYFVPVYNESFEVCDLRLWRYKKKEYSTRNGKAGIYNLNAITTNTGKTVYICGSFRDALSLNWLFWRNKVKDNKVAIATPGENTFRHEWIGLFENREVVICFDHDESGYGSINNESGKSTGGKKIWNICRHIAKSVKYIKWPEESKTGYDIKDFINEHKSNPTAAYTRFLNFETSFHTTGTPKVGTGTGDDKSENGDQEVEFKFADFKSECEEIYRIDRDFENAIKVSLSTSISHHIPGDNNVWMFLVGGSGSGKTEICQMFMEAKRHTLWQSTLTSKALISGLGLGKSLVDPSILNRVNQKCLIVNDFTTVLDNEYERKEVFSILRDAYLGFVRRPFGNGERIYNSKFSCLFGVTPIIQQFNNTPLGERFLRYRLPQQEGLEELALELELFGKEGKAKIKGLMNDFFQYPREYSPEALSGRIPQWFKDRIVPLAKIVASMRTIVVRFEKGLKYGGLAYRPEKETGGRVATQFQKLALGLCLLEEKPYIDEEIYSICKKIAIDTISDFEFSIVRTLVQREGNKYNIKDLTELLKVEQLGFYLKDLQLLDMIERNGDSPPTYYASKLSCDLFKRAGLV